MLGGLSIQRVPGFRAMQLSRLLRSCEGAAAAGRSCANEAKKEAQ